VEAVIVVEPPLDALTKPVEFTEATLGALELHPTWLVQSA